MPASTLPTLTRTIDNAFMHTWYDIKPAIVDQIMLATPIWAALKMRGCMVTQVGGDSITRGVRYQLPTPTKVIQGDILPSGNTEIETMARWNWSYVAASVQRALIGQNSDQQNQGDLAIKNLVATKLEAAKDGLSQSFETDILATASDETNTANKGMRSLNDHIPLGSGGVTNATRSDGTFGLIARPTTFTSDVATVGNTWWTPKYKAFTANKEQNLVSDMKTMYNNIFNNQKAPNLIVTTQDIYELYEEFGLDAAQIVKSEGGLADLGFDTIKYKGKDMIWTPNCNTGDMLFLNTDYIEVVYDPTMWFDMTEFKNIPLQGERVAHIMCAVQTVGTQPRRHGRLYT